ncbi:MAG: hypothetical protein RLY70_479, partial [Planctomycetota bacterium]
MPSRPATAPRYSASLAPTPESLPAVPRSMALAVALLLAAGSLAGLPTANLRATE